MVRVVGRVGSHLGFRSDRGRYSAACTKSVIQCLTAWWLLLTLPAWSTAVGLILLPLSRPSKNNTNHRHYCIYRKQIPGNRLATLHYESTSIKNIQIKSVTIKYQPLMTTSSADIKRYRSYRRPSCRGTCSHGSPPPSIHGCCPLCPIDRGLIPLDLEWGV